MSWPMATSTRTASTIPTTRRDRAATTAGAPGRGRGTGGAIAFRPAVGWLPASLAAILTLAILLWYGVRVADLALFCGYLLLGILLPGTLLWRALRGGPGLLPADVVGGAALGYALEVLTYLAARAVGAQMLVLLMPVGIVISFLAVPRLRRHWRGSGERVDARWAWAVAAVVLFVVLWSAVAFFRLHGLTWPAVGSPYIDMPFQLAMAAELKHHVPPAVPYVVGEPLRYHWFVYAELAATSWVTGVELQVLLLRLSLVPIAVAFTVGIAILAGRLVAPVSATEEADGSPGPEQPTESTEQPPRGPWWAGPAAALLTFVAAAPSPYAWLGAPVPEGAVLGTMWLSPTQTFGAMLVVPAVVLLSELLRDGGGRPAGGQPAGGPAIEARTGRRAIGRWVLLSILITVITGAKATYLPLLLAALLLVIVGRWAVTRRPPRSAILAAGLVVAALGFAQFVLFAGSTGGLTVAPFATAQLASISRLTGLAAPEVGTPWLVVLPVVAFLFCWLILGGGGWVVLLTRPRLLADPAILLCFGVVAAGVGAALMFSHPGGSQLYFLNSARPYLACLAVTGLAVCWPRRRTGGAGWVVAAVGLMAGAASVWLLRHAGDRNPPSPATLGGTIELLRVLARPYAILFAVAAGGCLGMLLAARWRPGLRSMAVPAVLLFAVGLGGPAALGRITPPFVAAATRGWQNVLPPPAVNEIRPALPAGGLEAGRWLRDHSEPDDVVATNSHCRMMRQRACDNRSFWVAAYTERRVLVGGWGYTATAHEWSARTGTASNFVPYWDRRRLADNEAVFSGPSARRINRLRDGYGVRWLLVDQRVGRPPARLARFAIPRFAAGECQVYELPD